VPNGSLLTSRQRNRNFLVLLALTILFAGCKKEHKLPAAKIHAISREFAAALKAISPKDVHTELNASEQPPTNYDRINVTVRADSPSSAQALVLQSLRELSAIATRHHLSRDGPLESGEGLVYAYEHSGVVAIMVHFREKIGTTDETSALEPAERARLAIILDDLGNDRSAADAIFALKIPITMSVLPNHPHSAEIAEAAHRHGYQVMLHLPMQSVGNERPESQELHSGMSAHDVAALVDQSLRDIPDVVGVNNHQGSQSTADATLMDELMPVLRQHKLFYVDSRTTTATVAYDEAQRLGIPSGFRNVPFLDDVAEVAAVRKQLQRALRGAREKGAAIAIGHPHPATLQALREVLPQAKSQGVTLVFASELVH
jgi:polysaccharide deacetylase 2 family uncharacterized protein YibQ